MVPVSYQLFIELERDQNIQIGRFGRCFFPAGRYVYTGSARRNLAQRIARHRRRHKTKRWHIDYLLARPAARIVRVSQSSQPECALNRHTAGRIQIPGFGASDCRGGCGSHLKYQGPLHQRLEPERTEAPAE